MRKLYFVLSLLMITSLSQAQLVPTQTQAWLHITSNSTVKKLIDVDNVGSSPVSSYWEIIQDDVKSISGWDVEYCDCNNCYSFKDYPANDTCQFDIASNDFVTYSLQIKPGTNIQTGSFKVVVYNLTDGSETDTLTFVVSDQAATGLTDQFFESGYKLYPNPSANSIQISGLSGGEQFRILDVSGKEIMQTNAESIDVQNLPQGAYLIEIDNGREVVRQRFMKD